MGVCIRGGKGGGGKGGKGGRRPPKGLWMVGLLATPINYINGGDALGLIKQGTSDEIYKMII